MISNIIAAKQSLAFPIVKVFILKPMLDTRQRNFGHLSVVYTHEDRASVARPSINEREKEKREESESESLEWKKIRDLG